MLKSIVSADGRAMRPKAKGLEREKMGLPEYLQHVMAMGFFGVRL
jgi:hypothetical protein